MLLLVVTGATDGIGKEFALQLARAGFNILLVSRTEEKLKVVAGEIGKFFVVVHFVHLIMVFEGSKYSSVETGIFAIDFSVPTEEQYAALARICAEKNIGVLGRYS